MTTSSPLQDQVAIITGGGTGIGLAIARRLGELGARIVMGSRSAGNIERGSTGLGQAGLDPLGVQVDVRNPEQVDEMVTRTVRHFGRIDILVNNAAGNFICRAEELSPNGWNTVVGIVLNGSFYCSRAVGRHIIARGMSRTQTPAVEWARHNIRVNAVAPGPIESPGAARQLWSSPDAVRRITDMVPLRRWGKPEDVANAVAFLVSDQASFITGEILTVDGGAWLGRGTFGFV